MTTKEEIYNEMRFHMEEAQRLKNELRAIEDQENREAIQGIPELTSIPFEYLYFGYWECEDSPTKQCIYNVDEDPMRDYCLICEDPAERK